MSHGAGRVAGDKRPSDFIGKDLIFYHFCRFGAHCKLRSSQMKKRAHTDIIEPGLRYFDGEADDDTDCLSGSGFNNDSFLMQCILCS